MLPRRPKYVASGRDQEMAQLMDIAVQGGVLLLQGACGVGKTSLALECAHRLPRALWFSAWPGTSQSQLLNQLKADNLEQLVSKLEEDRLCLFVDHGEVLEGAAELLAWASHHVRGAGLVVICDRRLRLSPSARVSLLNLDGVPQCQELPPECQLLSLCPGGLPRAVLGSSAWLESLEERFLTRPCQDWVGLHPGLISPGQPSQHQQLAALLEGQPITPTWVEQMFFHLQAAQLPSQAQAHFLRHHLVLLQAGRFDGLCQMCDQLLIDDPRLALAHYVRGEAQAGMGKLELARADFANALHWGDPQMQLRSLAGRAHLLLDLGQLTAAQKDAEQALALAASLGGRQPGQVKALNVRSRICNLRGQSTEAEQWARRALQLAQSQHDPKGEAYSTFILAQALGDQQRNDESLQHCLTALQFARQQKEQRLALLARYWAGAALLRMGRLEWAEEMLAEAWRDSHIFGDPKMQALGELMRAQSLLALGEASRARTHVAQAEKLVQRSGYPLLAVRGLLLKQSLEDDPELGKRAQILADSVGVSLAGEARQEVWTQGQCRPLPPATIDHLRNQRDQYDLFLDLEHGQAVERQLGNLLLLGKRIPVSILLQLMKQPGQTHSTESLYAAVWGHPYEGESSAAQVRKNISALRNLLEPERKNPRYLLVREHAYGVAGGYYFNETASYCVIHPLPLGIPRE